MAEVLGLALGFAIGWLVKARFARRAASREAVDRLAAAWREHCEAHAKSLKGSVALTAPES